MNPMIFCQDCASDNLYKIGWVECNGWDRDLMDRDEVSAYVHTGDQWYHCGECGSYNQDYLTEEQADRRNLINRER